jgi:hypothetical protein
MTATDARNVAARLEPWRSFSMWEDDEVLDHVLRLMEGRGPRSEWELGGWEQPGVALQPAEPEIEDLAEHHFIGFAVLDANGDPYPDVEYQLRGPGGEREEGSLGSSGQLRKDDVDGDDYTLVLREIDAVQWSEAAASSGQPLTIDARVLGYDDGAGVEVRLFREYAETDDDVLQTLTGEVQGGTVQVAWAYRHDRNGPFARCHGIVHLVAEVRVGKNGPWAKTMQPLALQLPTVVAARWSTHTTAPGREVELLVETAGVVDGTPMSIQVFARKRDGTQLELELFEESVEAGVTRVTWSFPPPSESNPAQGESECFFVATLDGDDFRTCVSDTLWVTSHASPEVTLEQAPAAARPG